MLSKNPQDPGVVAQDHPRWVDDNFAGTAPHAVESRLPNTSPLGLARLARLDRPDAIRPHHLVVLVLDDVAMPDELTRRVELRPHACDLARISDNGILETALPGLGRRYIAVKLKRFQNLTAIIQDQTLAVHHLKRYLVDVYRVRITCGVVELPYFRDTLGRVLGNWIHP